jgi:O-antigen/teichoic acid export membrane protein
VNGEAVRRVGRGTAVNWSAWILARALALATLVMLARALGTDELGALLAALAAGVLGAALATGGLADATARQAAATERPGVDFGRGDLRRALRRFAVVLPFVLAAVIAITLSSSDGVGTSHVVAASSLAVTQGATTIAASVFRARAQPGRFALAMNLASSAGRGVVALLALMLALSGGLVLWAFAGVNAAVAAVTWHHAARDLPDTATAVEGTGALQLGGVIWGLLGNLDVVIVGLLLGAGAAGTYSVSLRVAEFSAQFLIAISLFYLPEATRLAVQGGRAALISLYRAACRWSAATTLLAAGVGFVAADDIAAILFPDDPSTSTTILRVLFAGYAVQGALGVSYATLAAIGAYGPIRSSSIVSLPLIVAGTVLATQFWGATGAACATLAAYVSLNAWWSRRTATLLGATPFERRYMRSLGVCFASTLAGGFAGYLLADAEPVAALLATTVAALGSWMALLPIAGALDPNELVGVAWWRRPRARLRDAPRA